MATIVHGTITRTDENGNVEKVYFENSIQDVKMKRKQFPNAAKVIPIGITSLDQLIDTFGSLYSKSQIDSEDVGDISEALCQTLNLESVDDINSIKASLKELHECVQNIGSNDIPLSFTSFYMDQMYPVYGETLDGIEIAYQLSKVPKKLYVNGTEIENPKFFGKVVVDHIAEATNTVIFKAVDTNDEEVEEMVTIDFNYQIRKGVLPNNDPSQEMFNQMDICYSPNGKDADTFSLSEDEYLFYFIPSNLEPKFFVDGFGGGLKCVGENLPMDVHCTHTGVDINVCYNLYRTIYPNLGKISLEIR